MGRHFCDMFWDESARTAASMSEKTDWVTHRRCPKCAGTEVRRSPRRGFVELVLLAGIGVRPFRCQGCGKRFFRRIPRGSELAYRRRHVMPVPDTETSLPVLVYGYRADKELFQEETGARLVGTNGAVLSLKATVELGQALMLLSPGSDEEQPCEVAAITRENGKSIVELRFTRPAWEFWSMPSPAPHH
jgi:hypothetical protein